VRCAQEMTRRGKAVGMKVAEVHMSSHALTNTLILWR
jgi:hypothetical protein